MEGDTNTTTTTTTETAAPAETTQTTAASATTASAEATQAAEAKPFLGGEEAKAAEQAKEPAKDGAAKPAEDAKKEYTDEDYAKAIVKDEKLLGNNKAVQIDAGYIKAMAPVFKETGVSPEQANKLANAFAKVQIDSAREALKARNEYFEKMKNESMQRYNEGDWKQINAGIDSVFKRGGTMNFVVRNSELGADPEFLALMHKVGAAVKPDAVAGAASGAGEGAGDGNSFAGINKIW